MLAKVSLMSHATPVVSEFHINAHEIFSNNFLIIDLKIQVKPENLP